MEISGWNGHGCRQSPRQLVRYVPDPICARSSEAAEAMKLTARDLKTLGVVDEVIPEPPEGAHACPEAAFAAVDRALSLGLEQVLREGDFAQKRYEKFRGMGAPRSRREAP